MAADNDSPENCSFIQGLKPADVALFRSVAREAAEQAVSSTFTKMGLDPGQPLVSQKIFVMLRDMVNDKDTFADFDWLRRTRKRMDGAIGKAIATAVGIAVLSGIQAIWAGASAFIGHPVPPMK